MKNNNFLGAIIMTFMLSGFLYGCNAFAEQVKGSGNVLSKEIKVDPFTQLKMNGVFNVLISQGEKESLTIEADDNLIDLIEVKNNGNVLTIKQKKESDIKPTKFNVYITVKDLEKIETNSVGDIKTTTPLNLKNFDLSSSCVGDITLEINCERFYASISSVGDLSLKGKANETSIRNSSVGNVKAIDFISENLSLENSGVGNVEVYANKEISLISSGVGNVKYKGDAIVKHIENKGVGKVKKI
jgi:hypothetical protein